MPVAVAFQEPSTFMVRAFGRVTFEEARVAQEEILADPHLCCGVQMLVDGSAVSGTPSTSELRVIATEMRPMVERGLGPVAIAAESPFVYGVARMFCVFAEMMGANVHAFRYMDEAKGWLASQSVLAALSN